MIVFHFPPLTYKGEKGATGKNVRIISQTPPHETLKCVKDCFLFPPYDPLVWLPRQPRSTRSTRYTRWDHSQRHALHTQFVICKWGVLYGTHHCFLFLPYDRLVWWPRRSRCTRWDHSQRHALHTHSVICFCTLVSEGFYMVRIIIWECKTHAHTHTPMPSANRTFLCCPLSVHCFKSTLPSLLSSHFSAFSSQELKLPSWFSLSLNSTFLALHSFCSP